MEDNEYKKEIDFNNFLQILEFKDVFYFNMFLDHPLDNRIQYGQLKKGLLWSDWGFNLFQGKAKYPLFISINNRHFSKKEMILEIQGIVYDDDEEDRQMDVGDPFTKHPKLIWAKEGCQCRIKFINTKKAQLILIKTKNGKHYNYAVVVDKNNLKLVLEDENNQGTLFDVLFPPMNTYEEYITQQLINKLFDTNSRLCKYIRRQNHFFGKPIFSQLMTSKTLKDLDQSFQQLKNIEDKIDTVEFVLRNQPQFQEHVFQNQGPGQTYDLVDSFFDNIKNIDPLHVVKFFKTNFNQLNSLNLKEIVIYTCEKMAENDQKQLNDIISLLENLVLYQTLQNQVMFLPNNMHHETLKNYYQQNQENMSLSQKLIFLQIFTRNKEIESDWKIEKSIIQECLNNLGLLDLGQYQTLLISLFLELSYLQVQQNFEVQERDYFILDCIKKLDQYPKSFQLQDKFNPLVFQELLIFYSQINYQAMGSIKDYFCQTFMYFSESLDLINTRFEAYVDCLEQLLLKSDSQQKHFLEINFDQLYQHLNQENLQQIKDFSIVQTLNILFIFSRFEYIEISDIRIKTLFNSFKEQVNDRNLMKYVNKKHNFFTSMYQLGINNLDAKSYVLQTFLQIKQDMPEFSQYAEFYIAKLNNYNQ